MSVYGAVIAINVIATFSFESLTHHRKRIGLRPHYFKTIKPTEYQTMYLLPEYQSTKDMTDD